MDADEAAFLATIRANPADDLPRLVFADWLEERGEPRGPWVRDPDIWPFMAPDATNPVPRLLEPEAGTIPKANQEILVRLGPDAVPALIAALKTASFSAMMAILATLDAIGPARVEAIPELADLLRDPAASQLMRDCAASALGAIGTAAVPTLLDELRGRDHGLRVAAAGALGRVRSGRSGGRVRARRCTRDGRRRCEVTGD